MKKLFLIAFYFFALTVYSQNPTPFDNSIRVKNLATQSGTPDIAVFDNNKVLKKIAWSSLPAGSSSVLEYTNFAAFPGTGAVAKIYVDKATNIIYRWTGSAYVILSPFTTPSLQEITDVDNETSNPIKVDELGLFDGDYEDYFNLSVSQATLSFYNPFFNIGFSIQSPNALGNKSFQLPKESSSFVTTVGKGASFTAQIGLLYVTKGEIVITDPTSVPSNTGYMVHVIGDESVIGSVGYTSGALVYRFYNGTSWISKDYGAGGSGSWGGITGTLSSQTDLQNALNAKQDTLSGTIFGAFANSLDAKTTPIDADLLNIVDTADGNKQRKVTFTNAKAFFKTYFDTLYQTTLVSGTTIKTVNSNSLLGSGNIAVEPTITAGTSAQYYRGDKTFQTLDKSAVGLGNVDNTSDANKPVSTATQTALDLKADKSSTSTIIIRNITPSTALTGTTSETQITSFNFTIPANTFSASDILKVETIAWEKSGTANSSTCRIKLSNTNNYAGASNILILAASANNINMRGTRTYKIAGGNLKGLMSSSANGIFNDNTLTSIAVSTLALDVTQPIYGFVSLNNTSSADSTIVNELIISKW